MSRPEYCRYYISPMDADKCEKGVPYASVRTQYHPDGNVPCYNPIYRHLCQHFEPETEEQKQAEEEAMKKTMAVITRIDLVASGESTDCPHCGRPIWRMEKVGRCVYVRPCNCRFWQGDIPESWKESE
jgi:hypothetical protein